ncbi:class I adenylate-forming enzyme family protein [Embleya scabrispora]|uniref:class I adenylate-forming enzyme family protein n=1 Tax=Embleya scabrispora TaxID=159449 RepID=UPI00035F5F41|nr:class I adenylate-forming enzyme family protein [Embleya scabrispora]MYS82391.1 AMP-binding protein [Streptomyces sp. SID5474]
MLDRTQALAELTGPESAYAIEEVVHDGIPWRVLSKAPPTLRAVFEDLAAYGTRDALVAGDERIDYAEQHRLVAHLARHLATECGVRRGDRVAIAMRNHLEWPLAFWATQVMGAVAVPLNAWWTADELRYALEDSGSTVLICDGERAELIRGHLDPSTAPGILVVRSEAPPTAGETDLSALLRAFTGECALPAQGPEPFDDATILYTSGTTGRPKGAVGTHHNHTTNLHTMQLSKAVGMARLGLPTAELAKGPAAFEELTAGLPAPSNLQVYPFFHIAGLAGLYIGAAQGAKLCLMHHWDTATALELIETERITTANMVPTLLRRLVESPLRARRDLSSLTSLGAGGSPVPPDLVGRVGAMSGNPIVPLNAYGMTETTCVVVANSGDDYYAHPDSVGRPVPTADLRVADPLTGEELPTGQTGEIRFRGPQVVRGYWNRPRESEEAFPNGWFRTGDLGYTDAEGLLYVVDRLKDVIIRGGENVYSAEVEAVLFEHPAIADVAVVGVAHHDLGEEVAAVVRLHVAGAATAAELRGHVARRLAAFKVPTLVRFTERALPRNAVGKVLKRELRDMLAL